MLKSHNKSILETLGRRPVHPFPARMAAGIALEALGTTNRRLTVLDPMSGSGTVLAVARAKGHKAIGVDLDPLAVLLANVWTTSIVKDEVRREAERVLKSAKARFCRVSSKRAYPAGIDKETKKFIRYWFDSYSRSQLAALAWYIGRVGNESIRNVLWCGFSRLIITKSAGASLAMDLSHSRPHKSFDTAPVKPFTKFISAVEIVVANCPAFKTKGIGPATNVKVGDARRLRVRSGTIDLVLTSPPYLNAIDYMRCSKFSLVWMGYTVKELAKIRSVSVGTEVGQKDESGLKWISNFVSRLRKSCGLSKRDEAILYRYAGDMELALAEAARVLKQGGRAVYVVGNSTVKGIFIRNSTIVRSAALKNGLKVVSTHTRTLPANRRYLPPPRKLEATGLDARMRQEVVLVFEKAA